MIPSRKIVSAHRLGVKFVLFLGLTAIAAAQPGGCQVPIPTGSLPVVEGGSLQGMIIEGRRAVQVFKGIPYAAPPVGDLRWKPPQPVAPWSGVRACTEFGPSCPQPSFGPIPVPGPFSEDCLYLNVWAPYPAKSRLPVMVWIHGGGFFQGSGSIPHYDGAALAQRNAVVVTINYRLGALGFMAHPLLSQESPQGVSGNYGLLDQVAALQWVQRNIAGFGGDPGCVTIFGESAGAHSVTCLMVSPLAEGLFHRAVAESGFAGDLPLLRGGDPGTSAEEAGGEIAATLGCDTAPDPLAAMRAKSADELIAAYGLPTSVTEGSRLQPNVDGWVLPGKPALLFEQGLQRDIPFMTGTNADEGTLFIPAVPTPVSAYHDWLAQVAGEDADAAFALFPADNAFQVPGQMAKVLTTGSFETYARFAARSTGLKQSKGYLYQFTRVSPLMALLGLGATHGSEIPYVFGNYLQPVSYNLVDHNLRERMADCWVRFATTGDPNGGDLPAWPAYGASSAQHLEFGDVIRTGDHLHAAACDLGERVWRRRW